MSAVECSCGVVGCPELGWPHEWDPITAGDTCTAQKPAVLLVSILNDDGTETVLDQPHRVSEPYVRYGSGYACLGCVETPVGHSRRGR